MSTFDPFSATRAFLGGFGEGRALMGQRDDREERRRRWDFALAELAEKREAVRRDEEHRAAVLGLDRDRLSQDQAQFDKMMGWRNEQAGLDRDRLDLQRNDALLAARRADAQERDLSFQIERWLEGVHSRKAGARALTDFARENELFGPDPGVPAPGGVGPPAMNGGVYGAMLAADPDLIRATLPHLIEAKAKSAGREAQQRAIDAAAREMVVALEGFKSKDPQGYADQVAKIESWRLTAALPGVDAIPTGIGGSALMADPSKRTLDEIGALRGELSAMATTAGQAMRTLSDPMADEETVASARSILNTVTPGIRALQERLGALNAALAGQGGGAPAFQQPGGSLVAPAGEPFQEAPTPVYGPPGIGPPSGVGALGQPGPGVSPGVPAVADPGRARLQAQYTPEQAATLADTLIRQTVMQWAKRAALEGRAFDWNRVPAVLREPVAAELRRASGADER